MVIFGVVTNVEDEGLSIGEVARRTGLSVHTLRYYEREGLLITQHIDRGTSGRRRYCHQDVMWLQMCVKLRASGMPLAKIRRYVELVREGQGNESQRLELLREHQRCVQNQLVEIAECLRVITRKVGIYERRLADGTAQSLWATEA